MNQGRHGQFLAGKAPTVAATQRRATTATPGKIQARPRPWGALPAVAAL